MSHKPMITWREQLKRYDEWIPVATFVLAIPLKLLGHDFAATLMLAFGGGMSTGQALTRIRKNAYKEES